VNWLDICCGRELEVHSLKPGELTNWDIVSPETDNQTTANKDVTRVIGLKLQH